MWAATKLTPVQWFRLIPEVDIANILQGRGSQMLGQGAKLGLQNSHGAASHMLGQNAARCFRFLWPCIVSKVWRERKPRRCNNQMFIGNFCLNMFRASLCPSSGEQRSCYCIRCTALVLLDSGCGALRCRMWALQMFIINFCLNMFRASLCPSSGEQRSCYCIRCTALVLLDVVGSGCGALRCRMRALQIFIINFRLNMFRASLCPSSGDDRPCVTVYGVPRWFCWMWLVAVVVGSGCGALQTTPSRTRAVHRMQ